MLSMSNLWKTVFDLQNESLMEQIDLNNGDVVEHRLK